MQNNLDFGDYFEDNPLKNPTADSAKNGSINKNFADPDAAKSSFLQTAAPDLDTLFVLTTSRGVRLFSQKYSALTPPSMQITEFFERAILIDGLKSASYTERVLLLKQAAHITQNSLKVIGIADEFFIFLKSSEYIFKLFKEISHENRRLNDLRISDIYAEFDEHLDILERLLDNYLTLLEANGLYDEISLASKWRLNADFIARFSEIRIKIDGILSGFEWDILIAASKICPVTLGFTASPYNQKLISQIAPFCGEPIENGYHYSINLSAKSLKSSTPAPQNKRVNFASFKHKSAQCAFIFDEISKMMRGDYGPQIAPQNIAVILPDEGFGEILKNTDTAKMLNFARGIPFTNESIFKALSRLKIAANSGILPGLLTRTAAQLGASDPATASQTTPADARPAHQNASQPTASRHKFAKNSEKEPLNETACALLAFNIDTDFYARFLKIYKNDIEATDFEAFIENLCELTQPTSEAKGILAAGVCEVCALLNKTKMTAETAISVLLMRLSSSFLSDTGGGEVTAMGVLEGRGGGFEGVIIADFDDELVPKRGAKEMFLSSRVRAHAGLASYKDRENLQRFWYSQLIAGAKIASICCQENEAKSPSRFLNDFEITKSATPEEAYLAALCDNLNKIPTSDSTKPQPPQSSQTQIRPQTPQIQPQMQQTPPQPQPPQPQPPHPAKPLAASEIAKSAPSIINMRISPLIASHDIFACPLSFSRLNSFLSCERHYFYKYIGRFGEAPLLGGADNRAWGDAVHNALKCWFERVPNDFDAGKFANGDGPAWGGFYFNSDEMRREIFARDLRRFETQMKEHFSEGWRVAACECEFESQFCGVKIEGAVDRIDIKNASAMVIDYKSGAASSDSFQLAFYEALLKEAAKDASEGFLAQIGEDISARFYSFKDYAWVQNKRSVDDLGEVLEGLKKRFSAKIIEFLASDQMGEWGKNGTRSPSRAAKICAFCEYRLICKKELK